MRHPYARTVHTRRTSSDRRREQQLYPAPPTLNTSLFGYIHFIYHRGATLRKAPKHSDYDRDFVSFSLQLLARIDSSLTS